MARGQAVRRIDRPASTVWRAVADHRGIAGWGPGMAVDMERDGEPDAAGVGAIRVITGPGVRIREEITAFEPERRIAYRALSGIPLPGWAGEIELAERAGATTIRWSVTTTAPGTAPIMNAAAHILMFALVKAVLRADR
ncbi:MAG TPA: SRPBCC family protein [Pseudonocardiaceae bacterium]|nr:SRPBCC family protein [Pseudonocardiaceae bacterium]